MGIIGFGGYQIVIEGDQPRRLDAIGSLQAPREGQKMEIGGSLYEVTEVRTVEDLEARSEPDKIHTYPRVFVRRIGDAPKPPPRPDNDDDDPAPDDKGTVLRFKIVPLEEATEFDAQAEARARDAHAEQQRQTQVFVRRIGSNSGGTEGPTLIDVPLTRRREEATEFDRLADERAEQAHEEQERIEEHSRVARVAGGDESAPLSSVKDGPPRNVLPWRSSRS